MNAQEARELTLTFNSKKVERFFECINAMAKNGHNFAAQDFNLSDEEVKKFTDLGYIVEQSNSFTKIIW